MRYRGVGQSGSARSQWHPPVTPIIIDSFFIGISLCPHFRQPTAQCTCPPARQLVGEAGAARRRLKDGSMLANRAGKLTHWVDRCPYVWHERCLSADDGTTSKRHLLISGWGHARRGLQKHRRWRKFPSSNHRPARCSTCKPTRVERPSGCGQAHEYGSASQAWKNGCGCVNARIRRVSHW